MVLSSKAVFPLAKFIRQKQQWHWQWHGVTVLVLGTLGDVTQIEMILIAKASRESDIKLQYH